MSVHWIDYKGKKILYVDYRGQRSNEEHFQTLEEQAKILSSMETRCLILTNYEGTRATPEYMNRVKQLGQEVFDPKVERAAVLGITGLKEILLRAYIALTKQNVRPFDSEVEALEWLVK